MMACTLRYSNKQMSDIWCCGCAHFRERIVCATLTGRSLTIERIRADSEEPGLQEFEGSFLRLMEALTNGCQIEVNETGTVLRYRPGIITGGYVSHDCSVTRSLGWYIEGLLPLCVFAKTPVTLSLTGVTNDPLSISVDSIRNVTLPLLAQFGAEGAQLKVQRRGMPPGGNGLVEFSCPIVRELRSVNMTDAGLIKRVRGTAYCSRINPQFSNRMISSTREVFHRLLPDVYIHTDTGRGAVSPGYGLSLVAESHTGMLLAADAHAEDRAAPEDVGQRGAALLLKEVRGGGCIDSSRQSLTFLLMALGPEDVSRVRVGELTEFSVQTLRLIKEAFGVMFRIRADVKHSTLLLSCLGAGSKNFAKKVT